MNETDREIYVRGMLAKNFTQVEIAADLGCNKATITKWLKKWDNLEQSKINDQVAQTKKKKQATKKQGRKKSKKTKKSSKKKLNTTIYEDTTIYDKKPKVDIFPPGPNQWQQAKSDPVAEAKSYIKGLLDEESEAAESIRLKSAQYIIEHPTFFMQTTTLPKFWIPAVFHEKQYEIIYSILDPTIKIIFVEGVQRAGKSTAIFVGLHALVMKYPNIKMQFDLMAGKGDQARRILRDLSRDKIIVDLNSQMLQVQHTDYFQWFNATRIDAHETTVADIKGGDSNVGWIDEFDVAIKKDAEAVMTQFFTMRAEKEMKMIMSANMDKGMYMMLRDFMKEQGLTKKSVKFISILKKDCPHLLERTENDELLEGLSNVLVGKNFTQRRLHNKDTGTGDKFDQQSLRDAFAIYETLINTQFENPNEWWKECDFTVMAVDPSGTGHPFGWIVLAVAGRYLIEVESGMMEMGTDDQGQKWTPQRINMYLYQKFKQYYCKAGAIESNTSGPAIRVFFENRKKNMKPQNFGADGKYNARENYITLARHVLDDRLIALKNRDLQAQLTIYNPEERDTKSEKVKGDIADAFLHAVWLALGGMKYLRTHDPAYKTSVKIL